MEMLNCLVVTSARVMDQITRQVQIEQLFTLLLSVCRALHQAHCRSRLYCTCMSKE